MQQRSQQPQLPNKQSPRRRSAYNTGTKRSKDMVLPANHPLQKPGDKRQFSTFGTTHGFLVVLKNSMHPEDDELNIL
jgi:hypothetical protein